MDHGGGDVGHAVVLVFLGAESSWGLKLRGVQCAADSFYLLLT